MDIDYNKINEYINLKVEEIVNIKLNEKKNEIMNSSFMIDSSLNNLMLTSQIFDSNQSHDEQSQDNQKQDVQSQDNQKQDKTNKINICNIIESAKYDINNINDSICSDVSNDTITKNMTDVVYINNLIKNIDKDTISKISELETKIETMEHKYDTILSNVNDELNNIVEKLSKNLSSNFDKCIDQKIKPICTAIEILREKINTNIIDKLNDKKVFNKSVFSL